MKQQSSCPVELRGELLKAESLRDGQHVSQVIRCIRATDSKDYSSHGLLYAQMHVYTGAERLCSVAQI